MDITDAFKVFNR